MSIDTSHRPSISLDALTAEGDLQTRRDRKYIVEQSVVTRLVAGLSPETQVLDIGGIREFGYRTTYFDTPDMASYLGAAHRRRRRWKIRTRVYEATAASAATAKVEVKQREGREMNTKVALDYDPADSAVLTDVADRFIADHLFANTTPAGLAPSLITTYRRSTVFDPISGSRATFDFGLKCDGLSYGSVELDHVVLETKSAGQASSLDRALWAEGIRPIRVSKYCTGLAALRPELPRNKWHRTLKTYFA